MEWYDNPYFLAASGAVTGIGLVVFALIFFVFRRLRDTPTITGIMDIEAAVRRTEARLEAFSVHSHWTTEQIDKLSAALAAIEKERESYRPQEVRVLHLKNKEKTSGEADS